MRITPVRCIGRLVVMRLFPEDAAPLDVELRQPGEGAFRVFDGVGLSPIVEVADYTDLPEGQRLAFEGLERYLRAEGHAQELLSTRLAALKPVYDWARSWPPALALGLLALLFAGAARRHDLLPARRYVLGIFTLALGLRLAFGLWGPLHVNGQGALWVQGVLDSFRLTSYGPGYPELYGWARSLARPDLAIFGCNALLGALSAALAFRVGELSGLGRPAALAVGLVLAVDPISVRIAASESYLIPLGCLLMLMALSISLASRCRERGQTGPALWALLAAGLFAAQLARTHPVAWIPCALMPLLALRAKGRLSVRFGSVAVSALVIAGLALAISGDVVAANLAHAPAHGGTTSPLVLLHHGVEWAALVVIAILRRRSASSRALPWLGLAAMAADLITRRIYGQSALWIASFDRLYLPMMLWGVASYWPRRALTWRSVVGATSAAGVALLAIAPPLNTRTTEQLEYDFVAENLSHAPPGCWVAHVRVAGRRVISLPTYAVPQTPEGSRGRVLPVDSSGGLDALAARTPCLLYVHSSLCQSLEGAPPCRRVEEGASLEHIAGTSLEARPSYDGLPYDSPRVVVEIFRARARR